MDLPARDRLSAGSDEALFFRTRGGPTQGWGNVVRLASFASWCRDRGHQDCVFFAEGPPAVHAYLRERDFDVVELADEVSLQDEAKALAARGTARAMFVEMLDVTPERQRLLRAHAERLVVFDDLCDHVYDADLVVCGQSLPSHANQELSAPGTVFLTGPRYFLSRPEFLPFADRERVHAEECARVLVTLGGGDYRVGYLKAAHALAELGSSVAATFVLGPGGLELADELRALVPSAEVLGGVDDLEQRLWETDVAVVSAGYTKLEAAITQTPCVMMSVQWHQIPLAAEHARATGVADLGYMSYVDPTALAAALRKLGPKTARESLAVRARSVVDGRGFERVYGAALLEAAVARAELSDG